MKTLFIIEFIAFYIFFFIRAILLSIKVKKNIKANNLVLHIAVLCAGLSAILFIVGLYYPKINNYYLVIIENSFFKNIGLIVITIGLIFSVLSSIHLGNSWRIGIDNSEKTELITTGVYKYSRNPYFTSYDFVLIGTIISSLTVVVLIVSSITIVLFHFLILREEIYLENTHSEKYIKYKQEVRRYI